MITFKAKNIGTTTIQRQNSDNEFKDYKVSVVELEPNSLADRRVLRGLHEEWGFGDHYSRDIFYSFTHKLEYPHLKKYQRFLALTKQPKNFEILRSEDILGLIEITKGVSDTNQITFLQTNPDYMRNNLDRTMRGVGTALLRFVETIMPKGDIKLNALRSARAFYEANGYTWLNEYGMMLKKH